MPLKAPCRVFIYPVRSLCPQDDVGFPLLQPGQSCSTELKGT
jgi:hypothetical protein